MSTPNESKESQREFAWKSDHAYVKISAEESGGRYTLIEDNLTVEFRLPLHVHREHSEAFYVVTGEVEFVVIDQEAGSDMITDVSRGRTVRLLPGDSLFVSPSTPHVVRCIAPAKMLTLYQPGGLEELFRAYAAMTETEMADAEKLRAVDLAHDNVVLEG